LVCIVPLHTGRVEIHQEKKMNAILNMIHKLARLGEVKENRLISKRASFRSELKRMLAIMTALVAAAVIVEA